MDKKMKLDQLFGPKDSSAVLGSIFPPSSTTVGGKDSRMQDVGCKNKGTQGNQSKQGDQKETVESNYYSSSIYYGGQENYSQRGPTTTFKKDGVDDGDANGNSSNSASRGNWWQGSLYY
ncbi:hypothetical protein K1719_023634 [Acacia pycnantha]|nr:hypothetical protein K1719_023634 [Acacia pycnantha]